MEEHRSVPRHRVLRAATISFGGGAISCTVRNLAEHGALLDVTSPIGISAMWECESKVLMLMSEITSPWIRRKLGKSHDFDAASYPSGRACISNFFHSQFRKAGRIASEWLNVYSPNLDPRTIAFSVMRKQD